MARRAFAFLVVPPLLFALGAAGVVGGCSSQDPPAHTAPASAALYGGTVVPDASQLGIVYLAYVPNQDPSEAGCWTGTGVLLTNDVILTAAHVADYQRVVLTPACAKTPPAFLRVSMPDPTAVGGAQRRWISCGGTVGCGEWIHPKYVPGPGITDKAARNNNGEDAALIPFSGFSVKGMAAFYERPLTQKPTSDFHGKSVTCYGMSKSTPKLGVPDPLGTLRKADFTVIPFPHPDSIAEYKTDDPTIPLTTSKHMFAVSRGGGVTPTATAEAPDGAVYAIPVGGDSGGPCIDHTNSTDGEVVGIDHAGSGETTAGGVVQIPRWAHYSASSGFRDWTSCRLKGRVTPVKLDCDGDGQVDDSVRVRKSSSNTLEIVVAFNGGAQEIAFDTLVSESAAAVGCALAGDFNADGASDIIATAGAAATAIPYLFSGGFPFAFTNLSTWKPSGPYAYYTVGRFNQDSVDDVAAVRFDGKEDVFLGKSGVGLTLPAQFVPRGFNYFAEPGDQEAFAVSAPGVSDAGAGGNFQQVKGMVYLVSNLGAGFFVDPISLDVMKGASSTSVDPSSELGDLFGAALTWGSFDGLAGEHGLVIGAPGATVNGMSNAGMITYLAYDNAKLPTPETRVVHINRTVIPGVVPSAGASFGRVLTAGDFDGDAVDDLAIGSASHVQVIHGKKALGLAPTNKTATLSVTDLGLVAAARVTSLASGDFNCDGFEDLAVGTPLDPAAGIDGAGSVTILYGTASGLTAGQRQRIDESAAGVATEPLSGEFFGSQLVAGNFNGDAHVGRPCVDLAVTVYEGTGALSSGAVHVLYGGANGISGAGSQHLAQGGPVIGGTVLDSIEPSDVFGGSLAITRLDTDRFDDLLIGAWNENNAQGAAHALRGSAQGITAVGQAFFQQGAGNIPGTPSLPAPNPLGFGNRFGWSVGGTSNGLLALGAAWQTTDGVEQAGWIALARLTDTQQVAVASAVPYTEKSLSANAKPAPTPLRKDAFFGAELTGARPAFVASTDSPARFNGALGIMTSGGRFSTCNPDTGAPKFLSVQIAPACLWPPNHKLVAYSVGQELQVSVIDDCDPTPTVRVTGVTSDEGAQGSAPFGANGLCLRSERDGKGDGRTYTIHLEVEDDAGNRSTASASVVVPKSETLGCEVPASALLEDGHSRCVFQ